MHLFELELTEAEDRFSMIGLAIENRCMELINFIRILHYLRIVPKSTFQVDQHGHIVYRITRWLKSTA